MPQIRLRPMTPAEFESYLGWVIPDYAAELERNGRATPEEAMARARASFDQSLPHGLDTPDHVLLVGEDATTGERIGHLWFARSSDVATQAWVFDVMVDEPMRGRGYGRALMLALETEARARGFQTAGLNVFGDNEIARSLYLSLGYGEIARQLSKEL